MSAEQGAVDVPPHVVDYLREQNTLTLATASPGGVPRASTYLYVNDGPNLFFWTKPHTTTARHLEQNPVYVTCGHDPAWGPRPPAKIP